MSARRRRQRGRTLALAAALILGACNGDGGGNDSAAESTTTSTTTSTTASTTTTPPTTAAPATTTRPTRPGMKYGQPCRKGSHPDCIDPEGDGSYTYLEGGADCKRNNKADAALCSDLDGDGEAGYPDSG